MISSTGYRFHNSVLQIRQLIIGLIITITVHTKIVRALKKSHFHTSLVTLEISLSFPSRRYRYFDLYNLVELK